MQVLLCALAPRSGNHPHLEPAENKQGATLEYGSLGFRVGGWGLGFRV